MERVPDGIVSIVYRGDDFFRRLPDEIEIYDLNVVFSQIGLDNNKASKWLNQWGPTSIGPNEEIIVPGYPTFSKVAWMNIDSVVLSKDDTRKLIGECESAIVASSNQEAILIFRGIRDAAQYALETSGFIEFGHP